MQSSSGSYPRSEACGPRTEPGPGYPRHGRPAGPHAASRHDRLCKEPRTVTAGQSALAGDLRPDGDHYCDISVTDPVLSVQNSKLSRSEHHPFQGPAARLATSCIRIELANTAQAATRRSIT